MSTLTDEKVETLREILTEEMDDTDAGIDAKSLDRLNFRLSDAIREGASVTTKATGWGNGETACALHGAVISARARGYIK